MFKVTIKQTAESEVFSFERFQFESDAIAWSAAEEARTGFIYIVEDITAANALEIAQKAAIKFLQDTDFQVTRHRDQLDMSHATSLSNEEFQALLIERQSKRDLI